MSFSISIEFLARRYHATPWNHQVNEGIVEFPPSPWRILRALVSAYYKMPEQPPRQVMCELVTLLAAKHPSYVLPNYTEAHTRHYMPIRKEGRNTTTRVFDTFYLIQDKLQVIWTLDLHIAQIELLQKLCRQVSYLGRAESWAELTVVQNVNISKCNAFLFENQNLDIDKHYTQKLLVPLCSEALRGFNLALTSLAPPAKRGKVKWCLPNDVLEALTLDINELHSSGWNGIPGAEWVTYVIERTLLASPSLQKIETAPFNKLGEINLARYKIVSNVLPNFTEAISVGERLHQALISQFDKLHKLRDNSEHQNISIFTGRDLDGIPLKNHHHAWYFSEKNNNGKIDHVLVYAKQGFSSEAINALQNINALWGRKSQRLEMQLVWLGNTRQYAKFESASIVSESQKWQNITPLVLPRFPKCYRNGEPKIDPNTELQIDGAEHQVRKLLMHLGFPHEQNLVKVQELTEIQNNQYIRRQRYNGGGSKGPSRGYWFELNFSEPQTGPIALGYAAHYGLGLFVPIK